MRSVIKNTLVKLKENNKSATPDNYFIEFSKQIKNKDFNVYECDFFEETINKFTKEEQKYIKENEINSYSKLCKFILNRKKDSKKFCSVLTDILVPSFYHEEVDDINKLLNEVQVNPDTLCDDETL